MIELTIKICDKVKIYLDRYYDNRLSLEDRFFLALEEESIERRGRAYYLNADLQTNMEKLIKEIDNHQDSLF